jgi:lysophospholipase L1-like esterase
MNLRRLGCILFPLVALSLVPPARGDDKPDFARWEKAITAFEQQDKEKPPPKHAILFVGSSSIRMWNVAKSFPDLDVINRGFGGSHLADSVHFAPRIILKHQPRVVVVYAGDNDIAAGKTPEKVAADFRDLVRVVQETFPKTRIVYISIKPSILRWKLFDKICQTNALIQAECQKDERLQYVDVVKPMLDEAGKPRPELFVEDGLHLNNKGYELWTSLVKRHLK